MSQLFNIPQSLKEFCCFVEGNKAWNVYLFENILKWRAKDKNLPANDEEDFANLVKLWEKEL